MTKKLFVVLVVVLAIFISLSLVMAKMSAVKGPPKTFEKQALTQRQSAISIAPTVVPAIDKQVANVEATGRPQKGPVSQASLAGAPVRLGAPSEKEICDLTGDAAYFVGDWIYGLEYYANYQDPEEFGCTAVWPFQVTEIDLQLNFPAEWTEMDVSVQGFVFANVGTPSCPEPEAVPGFVNACSTVVYTYTVPAGGGYFELPMPLTEECCVYDPYFAVVYVWTDLYGLNVDMVAEDNITATCRSYNDYGSGWVDLLGWPGFPGPLMLYSKGYTSPQNSCPTEGDTCGVMSVTPSTIEVLPGGTADFTANVYFQGDQTSCMLTTTPDPACPSCVTTITPNPVDTPATSATISIATDLSTPPGTYVVDCGGSKASATLIVLALNDTCEIARWITASGYYFDGWSAGDQNAVMLDPAMCTACGPDIYPFQIREVKSRWVNWTGLSTSLDVIFHIYQAPTPYCDGPGLEIYQFPATITEWSPTYVTVPLPDVICVDGPFWLAAEYVDCTPLLDFPALRMSSQSYDDTCTQFNYYQGSWYEWADFWSPPPPGYLYLSAIGNCQSEECPITCDMEQDNGNISSLGGFWATDMKEAKYFDPEEWCTPPVYPYRIKSVSFAMYDYYGAGSGDYQVGIYLKCQDMCDGPGTKIYTSPAQTFDAGFPAWYTIDLPDPICVYEPFFAALECLGPSTHAPQLLYDDNYPVDTCHYWFWYAGDSPPWIEQYDFWSDPSTIGEAFIAVSGFTNDPVCEPPPCDTTLITLAGGTSPYYVWPIPDAYGDDFFNERFEMPADRGGTLEKFDITFDLGTSPGTPNPDFYVWLSDGTYPDDNNPPYQAIADFHIPYDSIVWYPGATTVETYSRLIRFDASELFHIGYSHAQVAGDTLSVVSTSCSPSSDRSSEYWGIWGTMLGDWSCGVDFMINAYICPGPSIEPYFTMKCTPSLGYASPGDVGVNVYKIGLLGVLGYNLPVDLSLLSVTPSANITAAFDPLNPQTLPDTVDVAISVDLLVPYGDYTLVFQGVGTDATTKTCQVTLRVQYPYDEDIVHFYHGWQRASNYGPVANGDLATVNNFSWYGATPLFDGSIISVTPVEPLEDHMAFDWFTCEHYGFIPTEHMVITTPWFGEMAYSNFYADTLNDVIPGEFDSVFVIGLSNVESTDFSIKIKIYYNPTTHSIPALYPAVGEDWDVGSGDWAAIDSLHNMIYQYDGTDPNTVFGIMRVPTDDNLCQRIVSIWNILEVYPVSQGGDSSFNCDVAGAPGPAYLARLVMNTDGQPRFRSPGFWGEVNDDHSVMISSQPFSLNPGEQHIEAWINFGRDLTDGLTWEMWYKNILRYFGYYRGDVNANDSLEAPLIDVSDLVYLINYQFKDGPPPLPFADQGDVNADRIVDLADVVYLTKYAYRGGTAPIDYVRFIPSLWTRSSLFTSPNWH